MASKVLMVCLGNICRSPLAEGILQAKANDISLYVDSAGTAGYHIGHAPDPRSIAVARKHNIDISRQRCRQFRVEDFEDFDMIFAMDYNNYEHIVRMAPDDEAMEKVALLLDILEEPLSEVPDPYYGGPDGFDHVFELIDRACERIYKDLITH